MTQLHRRRATTIVLLLLAGGAGCAFYSHSSASEQAITSRRTAAGRRAEEPAAPIDPSVSQVAAREQFNRTAFGSKRKSPPPRKLDVAAAAQPTRVEASPAETPVAVVKPAETFVPVARREPPSDSAPLPEILPATEPQVFEPQVLEPRSVALQPAPLPLPSSVRDNRGDAAAPATPSPEPIPNRNRDLPKFNPPKLTGINQVTTSIAPPGGGALPDNFAELAQPGAPQQLAERGELPRTSAPFYSTPRVADFTHRPLYFEEKALERNGRTIGLAQPVASFVHFFGTIPALPYKMGAQPPSRPMYTGNGIDLPSDHLTVRDRVRGVMTSAGVAVGLSAILP